MSLYPTYKGPTMLNLEIMAHSLLPNILYMLYTLVYLNSRVLTFDQSFDTNLIWHLPCLKKKHPFHVHFTTSL